MNRATLARAPDKEPVVRRAGEHPRARVLLIPVGALLAWLVYVAVIGVTAGGELLRARQLALEARERLTQGDVEAAQYDLLDAQRAFSRAERRLTGPALVPLRGVPGVRANLTASISLAAAGERTTAAAGEIARAMAGLPGGVSALAPSGGAIPVEAIESLSPALARADALLAEAQRLAEATPDRGLIGPVAQARADVTPVIVAAAEAVSTASAVAEVLPTFLGADEPKRYFFGAGNPAELRGAGGFLGAYAILTIDDGRVDIGSFAPIHDLATIPAADVRAPHADYAARYDRYGGAGFWLNLNMTPDFPSAAQAIERLYEEVTGQAVDGTIMADPTTLAGLLQATGPVDVPGYDATVDADNVVAFLANEAFGRITDPDKRKRLLGAVAASALDRFLRGEGAANPVHALEALGTAATGGHLLLHSRDDAVQRAFAHAGVDGRLLDPDGDYLAAVVNNAANNKADFYAERTVAYEVALQPEGRAVATATVELRNEAPTEGVPDYVIGPSVEGAVAGDNRSLLSVYCASGCERTGFRRSLGDGVMRQETELGHPVFTTMVPLGSGEAERVELDWVVDNVWTEAGDGGIYRLTVQNQPTIRPTRLIIDVLVPEGMSVVDASPGFILDGRHAHWDGSAPASAMLEVQFASENAGSVWDRLRRFLNRPLLPN